MSARVIACICPVVGCTSLSHAAFTRALIRASPIPRKFYFSLTPHRVAFGTVHEPRRRSGGTRLPRRAWLRGSQSSELCPRLGDLRPSPSISDEHVQLCGCSPAAVDRPPIDGSPGPAGARSRERERSPAEGKLTAMEPAGLRGRVRRRGAPSHAAAHASCAFQATHGARYGGETHDRRWEPHGNAPAHPQRPSAPSLAPSAE